MRSNVLLKPLGWNLTSNMNARLTHINHSTEHSQCKVTASWIELECLRSPSSHAGNWNFINNWVYNLVCHWFRSNIVLINQTISLIKFSCFSQMWSLLCEYTVTPRQTWMTSTEIEKGFSLIGLKSELQLDSFFSCFTLSTKFNDIRNWTFSKIA